MFVGKGFGKLILMGEHAVVYGKPAIGCSLDRMIEVRLYEVTSEGKMAGNLQCLDRVGRAAYLRAARAAGVDPRRFRVAVFSNLPAGQGLGSSAAFSVAVSRALLAAGGRPQEVQQVLELTGLMEKVFHGSPSGIDALLALGGGPVLFKKGEPPLPISPAATISLLVLPTGTSPSTRVMVQKVRRRYERNPGEVIPLLDRIEDLVLAALECLRTGETRRLGETMNENHEILRQLGVSSPTLESFRKKAIAAGALGAKLTGGGGGGAVICLARDPRHASYIAEALKMTSQSFTTQLV